MDRYCALAGDHNAIHSDLEAAQLRFPGVTDIIVPGGLIQITVTGIFGTEFPGDGSLGLVFSPERMRRPVCPGDEVVVVIELTRVRGDLAEFSVTITSAAGGPIGVATSRVLVPDETYKAWWERRRASA